MNYSSSDERVLLSIIVLTYNRKELVAQCLNSIYDNMLEIECNYEIIVVDDHSTDGTYEMLKKSFPHVIIIRHEENKLPCVGMSDALEIARGEFVIRIDDDNILKDHCIKNLLELVIERKDVAFCGAISYDQCGNLTTNIGYLYTSILKRRRLPYDKIKNNDELSAYEVDIVDNLYIFRREIIDLSIFKMSCVLFPWIFEDSYFQLRAKASGYKVMVEPRAASVHHTRKSTLNAKEIYYYTRSKALWLRSVYGMKGFKLGLIFSFFLFSTIGTIPISEYQISKWPTLIKSVILGARDGITFNAQALDNFRLQI